MIQQSYIQYTYIYTHIHTYIPDTYPKKTIIQKDTWTSLFIAALFTIAKTRKQLEWSTDR